MLLDFSQCQEYKIYKGYGGGNGNKIAIKLNNKKHMLKFNPKSNATTAYTNSNISEYLACHIIATLGLDTQKTYLGTYTTMDKISGLTKTYNVVACEDFNQDGYELTEFAALKNTCITSSKNGYGIELSSVLEAIEEQSFLDSGKLKRFFWDMFIADALVANFDRHNGNWGILVNEEKQDVKIAPIYDCGSCLYPQLTDAALPKILATPEEIEQRVFVFPNSAVKINNNKINYFDYISSLQNPDCNAALARIYPRIDMQIISQLIDNTPAISLIRKQFYQTILKARYEKILTYAYTKLQEHNKH